MSRLVTFAVASLALAGALPFVVPQPQPAEAEPAEKASVPPASVVLMQVDANQRIIHVPQPGERRVRASAPETRVYEDEDDYLPPRRTAPKPVRRVDAPSEPRRTERSDDPRRKPYSASPPPPPRPRRTVLSAPPGDAMFTPVKSTPRFETKAEAGEKFSAAPPPGYKPPSAIPPVEAVPPQETAPAEAPPGAVPGEDAPLPE